MMELQDRNIKGLKLKQMFIHLFSKYFNQLHTGFGTEVIFFRRKDSLYKCIEEKIKSYLLTPLPLKYSAKSRKSSSLMQSAVSEILKTKHFRRLVLDKA